MFLRHVIMVNLINALAGRDVWQWWEDFQDEWRTPIYITMPHRQVTFSIICDVSGFVRLFLILTKIILTKYSQAIYEKYGIIG